MTWTKLRRQQMTRVLAVTLVLVSFTSWPTRSRAQPAKPVIPTAMPVNQRTLRPGMRGSDVKTLQSTLIRLGFYSNPVTGYFDGSTEAAVRAAQRQYELPVDGVVGSATWQALLNSKIPSSWNNTQVRFVLPNRGAPGQRDAAATRGNLSCPSGDKPPLTALVPSTNLGLTVTEHPTFWFYVPYTLTPKHSIEFVLKDGKKYVYKTKFPGMGTPPGVVSLRLPSTVSLEADKDYDWYFLIYCDLQNKNKFVFVNGSVRRVKRSDLKSQLQSATPQQRLTLYATNGIWYEALTNLAERMRAYPQDDKLNDDWAGLLQSVGLEAIATESIIQCCTSK